MCSTEYTKHIQSDWMGALAWNAFCPFRQRRTHTWQSIRYISFYFSPKIIINFDGNRRCLPFFATYLFIFICRLLPCIVSRQRHLKVARALMRAEHSCANLIYCWQYFLVDFSVTFLVCVVVVVVACTFANDIVDRSCGGEWADGCVRFVCCVHRDDAKHGNTQYTIVMF